MGLPPTCMLTESQPSDPWSRADKKLALAYHILQKETCQKCGQPLWICRSGNKDLTFKIRKDVCYSSAEIEKYADTKNGQNLKKGQYTFAVAEMSGDAPLPSRNEYFESLAEE